MVVEMLRQEGGQRRGTDGRTGWRKATVRGFVSTLISKHALPITRARRQADAARTYLINCQEGD
jgi:hypothetical protein